MLASVHQGPPPSVTCPDMTRAVAGERCRTEVNETETETDIRPYCTEVPSRAGSNSATDGLDALQLPELFLIVGRLVQVERKLAVQPELGAGPERFGQPQGC